MPGVRRHTKHTFRLTLPAKHPKLKIGYKRAAGRGMLGTKTVLSKSHRRYNSTFFQMYPVSTGIHTLSMVTGWFPWTKNCKAAMAIKTALGLWFLAPVLINARPLSFIRSVPSHPEVKGVVRALPHWWQRLVEMRSYSKICNFGSQVGAAPQYARAPGSTGVLLIPRLTADFALVSLPSGQFCLLQNNAYVAQGGVSPTDWKFFINTKAGYWKNLGYATTVRGTVKNANDHPNGGRTRALKYPRTPWGKTAKKSRKPRVRTKLKTLVKRRARSYSKPLPFWASRLGVS